MIDPLRANLPAITRQQLELKSCSKLHGESLVVCHKK